MSRRSCPVVGAKEYPRLTGFILVARFARRTSEVVPAFSGARALVTQQSRQRAKWSFALIDDHVESSRTSVRRLPFSGRRTGRYGYRANVICCGARAEPAMKLSPRRLPEWNPPLSVPDQSSGSYFDVRK